MLKSGIPDMIPEKNVLLVIDPLKLCITKKYISPVLIGGFVEMDRA